MKRIFHHWEKWEDYQFNFYGGVGEFDKVNALNLCIELLSDLNQFEVALYRVTNNWKFACEHNLTNENMNRIAYLGQACCALIHNIPSAVSMGAFSRLTPEQQVAANNLAQTYLDLWVKRNEQNVTAEKV